MIRVEAFRRVNGYDPSIIAAEDDELCLRIRREGWIVLRIDADMTLHDMAMTRLWTVVDAIVCAVGMHMLKAQHGTGVPPSITSSARTRSALFWGLLVPLTRSRSGLAHAMA